MAHPNSIQRSGEFDPSLLQEPAYPWFQKGYAEFQVPKTSDLEKVRKNAKNTRFLVFLGTWCGDTHEQLPRFMKILNEAGVPPSSVRTFALGRDKNLPGWTDKYRVERLPTFVVLSGDKEIGRIVESPKKSVLEDLAGLLP
jgi:hypothetical protein